MKSESFRHIYRTSPIMLSLRRPDSFEGKCGSCEFNQVCGGSRSHAYAVTGNMLASDPTCTYVPKGWADASRAFADAESSAGGAAPTAAATTLPTVLKP